MESVRSDVDVVTDLGESAKTENKSRKRSKSKSRLQRQQPQQQTEGQDRNRKHHTRENGAEKSQPVGDDRKKRSGGSPKKHHSRKHRSSGEKSAVKERDEKKESTNRKRKPERSKRKHHRPTNFDESCTTATSVPLSLQNEKSNSSSKNNMSFEIDSPRRKPNSLLDDATSTDFTSSHDSMTQEQKAWAGISKVLNTGGDGSSISTSEVLPPALIGALREMKRGSLASTSRTSTAEKENDSEADESFTDLQSMPSLMDASFCTQATDLQSLVSRLTSANKVVISSQTGNNAEPLAAFCNQLVSLAQQPAATPSSFVHQPQQNDQTMQNYLQHILGDSKNDIDEEEDEDEEETENVGTMNENSQRSLHDSPMDNSRSNSSGSLQFQDSGRNSLGGMMQLEASLEEEPVFWQADALNNSMPSIATFHASPELRRSSMKKNISFGDVYAAVASAEEDVEEEDDDDETSESESRNGVGISMYMQQQSNRKEKPAFLEHSMCFGDFSTPQLVIPGVDELTVNGSETKERRRKEKSKPTSSRRSEPHDSREPNTRNKKGTKKKRRKPRKDRTHSSPRHEPEQFKLPSEEFSSFLPKDKNEEEEDVSVNPTSRRFPLFRIPNRFGSRPRDYLRKPTTSLKNRLSSMFMKGTTRKGTDETVPSREEACFFPDEKHDDRGNNMLLPW